MRTLRAFSATGGTTIMGWFKLNMDSPLPNSTTADPDDRYNAIGLAGVLTGDSDGHGVRALLELIDVDGELRLVALGRRLDGGNSQTFAANRDWRELLPVGSGCTWPPPSTSAPARSPSTATANRWTASTPVPTTRGSCPGPAARDHRLRPSRHQDRRKLSPGHAGAQPVRLPHGRPDVPRQRGLRRRRPEAAPPSGPLTTLGTVPPRRRHACAPCTARPEGRPHRPRPDFVHSGRHTRPGRRRGV
ncbi:hypothetical protein NKG94_12210 [Micromonospora sp. M12]